MTAVSAYFACDGDNLTPDLTTMPEEAGLATPPQEGQYKDWNGTRVPPSVFAALTERYRGQKRLGARQVEVLGFFTEMVMWHVHLDETYRLAPLSIATGHVASFRPGNYRGNYSDL